MRLADHEFFSFWNINSVYYTIYIIFLRFGKNEYFW